MDTTADLLKAHKAATGKTDTDLAADLGVSQSSVSDWVAGRTVPDDSRLERLAAVLGADLDTVTLSAAFARRRRAKAMEDAAAVVTQLDAEVGRLRDEVAELRALMQRPRSAGRRSAR